MTSSRRYPPNTHPADDWQGMAFTDHPPASATIDVASLVLPPIQLEQHQPQSEDQPATNTGDTIKTPARKRAKKPPPISTKHADGHQEDSDLTPTEELESGSPPSKKRKTTPKKKAKQPIVFDIPPIPEKEKKMTTFKGRLGYACLNTVLRNKRPAREAVFCSRTLRIDTIKSKGTDYMKELGKQNMRDLATLIQWNEDNVRRVELCLDPTRPKILISTTPQRIKFMRMSSEMFPFASHPEYGYTLEYAQKELTAAGDLAKKYGHRLTTHPGQFTQLGSPRKQVVDNAFRDLKYHCDMMDRMGLDKHSVMIIHGGGIFENDGGKPATLNRIKQNFLKLPLNVQQRIVLENDDVCYSAEDLLPLCEELDIPLVFDYHHDWIIPSSQTPAEMMPRILKTWQARDIKPKQHLSEPRPGAVTDREKRAHSDRCKTLPAAMPDDMDLMHVIATVEAKDKEQAVFEMYRIYNLEPVIHENLRPPSTEQKLATNGRKSRSPKKGKKTEKQGGGQPTERQEEEATMSSVAEDTDMISTAGSPGDTTGASIATDVTDSEEVIQPRASRSRSTTKRGSTAAVKTEEQEAVSPIKAKSSRKGSTQVKPGVAKEEVQPGVQAKDFGAAVQK